MRSLFTFLFVLVAALFGSGCTLVFPAPNGKGQTGGLNSPYVSGLLVVGTDYQSGNLCLIDTKDFVPTLLPDLIHPDTVAFADATNLYVLQRLGSDSVQIRPRSQSLKLADEYSLGAGSNPQAFLPVGNGLAVVVRYAASWIDLVRISDGSLVQRLDGSMFVGDDPDGVPEFAAPALCGKLLYVPIQHLNRHNYFLPIRNGELAVVDVSTFSWVDMNPATGAIDPIELQFADPYRVYCSESANSVVVLSVGKFGQMDGGVELVEPFSNRYLDVALAEQDAGGEIVACQMLDRDSGFAIVSNSNYETSLVFFEDGAISSTLLSTDGFFLLDILLSANGRYLFVADRSLDASGVRIFDTSTMKQLTQAPIDCGLPPFFFLEMQ